MGFKIMGLYSSLSLVGAMAVSALIAIWLFYKRSHRDDFPEETWDPYFDKNETGGKGEPEREIDDISEEADEAGLEPAGEELVAPVSTALADRIQGLSEGPPSPEENADPVYEFGDSANPVPEFDLGLDDQVEQIGGDPVSPKIIETADLPFAPDEAEGDSPAAGSPIQTPAYSRSEPPGFGGQPGLSGETATAPPGAPWWEGLPAPKDVFFRRGVAELMGVTVIDPPPRAEAGPGEASVPEASILEAPAPGASTLEAPETIGVPADTAAGSVAPDEAGEAVEPPASEFAGASPFGEEESETPLSLEEEVFEEDESSGEGLAPEEPVSLSDESAPAPEIPAADESDDSSFSLESISLSDEPDEAPVMYEPEGESASAPAEDEEISLSSPADSESSEAIDNFLSQAEPPSSASAGLVEDEIEPAPEADGEISPEPEDESYSDLGESEEMPMAFDLDAGGPDFIESDEPVQELPDGLEDGKFESREPEEFSETPTGAEEESPSGPGEEAPPAGLTEKIPEDPAEATLDSSELEEETELEEEPAEATLDPGEFEEEPGGADGE
ncbi:MAG: hypothetical protein QF701_14515, partial [Nitrospinota bacterium]|nr:hypothetical protein [Nitrospinota bacterium]